AGTLHPPVVDETPRRHQPITHVIGQEPLAAGAGDLGGELWVPPRVVDVEGDTKRTAAAGIEYVANVEGLLQRIDAGTIGRLHGMQWLDGERHADAARVFECGGDTVHHLGARKVDVA